MLSSLRTLYRRLSTSVLSLERGIVALIEARERAGQRLELQLVVYDTIEKRVRHRIALGEHELPGSIEVAVDDARGTLVVALGPTVRRFDLATGSPVTEGGQAFGEIDGVPDENDQRRERMQTLARTLPWSRSSAEARVVLGARAIAWFSLPTTPASRPRTTVGVRGSSWCAASLSDARPRS